MVDVEDIYEYTCCSSQIHLMSLQETREEEESRVFGSQYDCNFRRNL